MKRCWRCRNVENVGVHHINGNHSENSLWNLINLCVKCHDLFQGICDKCQNQSNCSIKKLQQCWRFEDALPPIFFRQKDMNLDIFNQMQANGNGMTKTSHKTNQGAKKGINEDVWGCKCVLSVWGKNLKYTCLRQNDPKSDIYPCKYFMEGEGLCLFHVKSVV